METNAQEQSKMEIDWMNGNGSDGLGRRKNEGSDKWKERRRRKNAYENRGRSPGKRVCIWGNDAKSSLMPSHYSPTKPMPSPMKLLFILIQRSSCVWPEACVCKHVWLVVWQPFHAKMPCHSGGGERLIGGGEEMCDEEGRRLIPHSQQTQSRGRRTLLF